jgi:hypothetical protein
MTPDLPQDVRKQIEDVLFAGRKIEAIKLYREHTSTGLAEAKNAVDDMEVQLRRTSPEMFVGAPAGKGCGGTSLLMAAAILGLLRLFVLGATGHWFHLPKL